MSAAPLAPTGSAGQDVQAVVFGLGKETFALPIGMVREILDHRDAFRMPNAPAWLMGLTDVRGASVPMVDLRVRLGMDPAAATLATRVLVVDLTVEGRSLTLGLVVDRVIEVGTFAADGIGAAPDIGATWRSDYIAGVVRRPDGFVILIDPACIVAGGDVVTSLADLGRAA